MNLNQHIIPIHSPTPHYIWKRKTHLREVRRHNSPILEFPSRQRLQRLPRSLHAVILDENLAHTVGLPAAAAGAGDLHLEHFAVFLAFFLDVFADFCWGAGVSKR